MDLFYNLTGVGDVLMIRLSQEDTSDLSHETVGDVTKIMNKQGDVLAYNVFKASTHFEFTETGKVTLRQELLHAINQLFDKEGLSDTLEFDFSPKFVVGYVTEKTQHENADKLSVCQVDVGDETLQIVCGAANVDQGQKVVVAKIGATMPSGLEIKPTELRGVPSHGMICSRTELDLPAGDEKGIYVLDDAYEVGVAFTE